MVCGSALPPSHHLVGPVWARHTQTLREPPHRGTGGRGEKKRVSFFLCAHAAFVTLCRRAGRLVCVALVSFPHHPVPHSDTTSLLNAARLGGRPAPGPRAPTPHTPQAGGRAAVGRRVDADHHAGRLHCVPGQRQQAQGGVAVSVGGVVGGRTHKPPDGCESLCDPAAANGAVVPGDRASVLRRRAVRDARAKKGGTQVATHTLGRPSLHTHTPTASAPSTKSWATTPPPPTPACRTTPLPRC